MLDQISAKFEFLSRCRQKGARRESRSPAPKPGDYVWQRGPAARRLGRYLKYLARLRKKVAKRVAGRRRSSSESPAA